MSEMIPQKVAEHLAQIPALMESQAVLTKSVSKLVELQVKDAEIAKSKEEIEKSMEEKMEAKVAEIQKSYNEKLQEHDLRFQEIEKSSRKQGVMGGQENTSILEKAEVKELIQKSFTTSGAFKNDRVLIEDSVLKSLVSYNNAQAGALMNPISREVRTIVNNAQVVSPLATMVSRISRASIQGTSYPTFDETFTDIKTKLEGMPADEKNEFLARGVVEIRPSMYTEVKKISNTVIHAVRAGDFSQDVIRLEYEALLRKFDRQVARDILSGKIVNGKGINGILQRPFQGNTKISVIPTAASDTLDWQDVTNLPSTLKSQYYSGAAFIFDKQAYNELYNVEAQDGHLKSERFSYIQNIGMPSLKTAFGEFPVIIVDSFPASYTNDHAGFANYPIYPGGATQVTAGYVKDGTNTGKVYAVFANIANCYTLYESTTFEAGIDDSFKDRITEGFNMMGLAKYVGGNVVLQEAIAIGYIS